MIIPLPVTAGFERPVMPAGTDRIYPPARS
jgi:hypothetical protein